MSQPKNDGNHISYSRNFEVRVPRDEPILGITSSDWQRLRGKVNHLISGSRWIEHSFNTFLAISLSLIFALPSIDRNNQYWLWYFSAMVIALTATVFSLVGIAIVKKSDGSTKGDILDELTSIEEKCIESAPNEDNDSEEQTEQKQLGTQRFSDQGQRAIELPLEKGGRFTVITATFQSGSRYWRAGLKLYSPNVALNKNPLGENTALFHFAFGNNQSSLTIYTDGRAESRRHLDLANVKPGEPVTLTIERNEKNFVMCYVNDEVLFNQRMSPELFSKAQFLTWGDGRQYEIELLNLRCV